MFFGCFKTLLHAVEDIILHADFEDAEKLKNYLKFRKIVDAIETITIAEWENPALDTKLDILAAKNRSLTLEKNKYENIFEATSDLVLVINDAGTILEMNVVAGEYFGDKCLSDTVFRYIDHPDYDLEMFLERYRYKLLSICLDPLESTL
jgi:PAS domain-containing protein